MGQLSLHENAVDHHCAYNLMIFGDHYRNHLPAFVQLTQEQKMWTMMNYCRPMALVANYMMNLLYSHLVYGTLNSNNAMTLLSLVMWNH